MTSRTTAWLIVSLLGLAGPARAIVGDRMEAAGLDGSPMHHTGVALVREGNEAKIKIGDSGPSCASCWAASRPPG